MSSGGNNACSHLDLAALADKKPLAVARYPEQSGKIWMKTGIADDKKRDDERRKCGDQFRRWQTEGKIDEAVCESGS